MPQCKDIVFTFFPFTSHEEGEGKIRPTVLISGKNSYGDIICLPITHTKTNKCFKLEPKHIDGKVGLEIVDILFKSYVSLEQPMTLQTVHIDTGAAPIAKLTNEALTAIKQKLIEMSCT